jgi:Na+/melibiose symporter-like transporter
MARDAAKDNPGTATQGSVSVIVVAWQSGPDLARCLSALAGQTLPPLEILLVDNASTDGAPEAAMRKVPGISLVPAGATLGFAAGLPLVHLIEPGPHALVIYAAYDAMWMLFYGAVEVASRALLGDMVDYDTLKTGNERSGEYVALWTLVTRATQAVGASAAFAVAGWFGYEASASSHSAEAIFGLKLTLGGLPAAIALVAAGLVMVLPMTRHRHDVIRRRLARRARRVALKTGAQGV